MKKYLSPGNLIVTAGGILAFVGMTAYFTDSVNLSVPTFFYGVPIFLIGLGLKTSEIPPVELFDKTNFAANKFKRPKELTALVKDVTRWRYGIKAHLESSLESLNLWDEDNPPQLKEIEEAPQKQKQEANQCPKKWSNKSLVLKRVLKRCFEQNTFSKRNVRFLKQNSVFAEPCCT